MKLVEEVRASVQSDGRRGRGGRGRDSSNGEGEAEGRPADEVIHDLTYNVPPDKLGKEGAETLATALEMKGRFAEAARVRSAAGSGSPEPLRRNRLPPFRLRRPRRSVRDGRAGSLRPAPGAAPPRPVPSSVDYLALGKQALVRGDLQNALAAANRQIELEPNSSDAYRLLAEVQLQRGEKTMAEALFKQSLRYNEKNESDSPRPLRLLLRGEELDRRPRCPEPRHRGEPRQPGPDRLPRPEAPVGGKPRACRAGLRGSVRGAPGRRSVLTEYAVILLSERKPDAAIEPLMRAVTAAPDREVVHANLAVVLRKKNQFREAEREYREALRCDPDYVPALVGLGTLQLQRQLPAEAIEPLRRADRSIRRTPTPSGRSPARSGSRAGRRRRRDARSGPSSSGPPRSGTRQASSRPSKGRSPRPRGISRGPRRRRPPYPPTGRAGTGRSPPRNSSRTPRSRRRAEAVGSPRFKRALRARISSLGPSSCREQRSPARGLSRSARECPAQFRPTLRARDLSPS